MKTTKFDSRYVKRNYASISFYFHPITEETKQSVKRDKRKGEHEVKTKCKRIHQGSSLNKRRETLSIIMNSASNYCTLYSQLEKVKTYCRSYDFRQISCPLNKHSPNKQNLRFLKFKIFKLISFSCNCYVITETSPYKSNPRFAPNIVNMGEIWGWYWKWKI